MAPETMVLLVCCGEDSVSVKSGLESSHYTVDIAGSASECLRYVEEKAPDLILLDVVLPDMDGFALRARLKTTGAKDVPVIFLAKLDMEMTKRVGILTADDFVAKPVNVPELILRIQKAMMMRCYRKPSRQNTGGRRRTG